MEKKIIHADLFCGGASASGWTDDPRSTLRILRDEARRWWYHRKLRENGEHAEARRREHESIRHSIRTLREAKECGGYLKLGHGSGTFVCAPNASITGFGPNAAYFPLAVRMGILVIDLRTADFHKLSEVTVRGPMAVLPGQPHDTPPYGSMAYAPLEYVVGLYRHIGAQIYNDPWADTPQAKIDYARRKASAVEQPSLLIATPDCTIRSVA